MLKLNKDSIILSLHIGHDAGATIVQNGVILSHVLSERISRLRHHFGIDRQTIEAALGDADLKETDIDFISMTATQMMPGLVLDSDYLDFKLKKGPSKVISENEWWPAVKNACVSIMTPSSKTQGMADYLFNKDSRSIDVKRVRKRAWKIYEILSPRYNVDEWYNKLSMKQTVSSLAELLNQKPPFEQKGRFHSEAIFTLGKQKISGIFIEHHMAHQCSSYFSINEDKAIIFSCDGGYGMEAGFVSIADKGHLTPLLAHRFELGPFYDYVAHKLGLGNVGGSGKLMGLASYGRGALLDRLLPPNGNRMDWENWCIDEGGKPQDDLFNFMYEYYVEAAKAKGYDVSVLGDPSKILEPAPTEIAHAVQHMVEQTLLKFFSNLSNTTDLDFSEYTLCISGGVALNCPTNTVLSESNIFKNVYVEPHCDDGGLPIGAAFYASVVFGNSVPSVDAQTSEYAMIGLQNSDEDVKAALEEYGAKVRVEKCDSWTQDSAAALADNKVIALCFGRSETGPRALGARSIVANVGFVDNWSKVNRIKMREEWRPFAPVCKAGDLNKYFKGGPLSPFMLFTHQVREEVRNLCPAITHVDHSARVQTVVEGDVFYDLLDEIEKRGDLPMIMNTSFNGPGVPIVQTASQALELLCESDLDMLFMNGWKIMKR